MAEKSHSQEMLIDDLDEAGLSRAEAEVYVKRVVEGLGRAETADLLEKAPSTVDTQHQRAKRKIEAMWRALSKLKDENVEPQTCPTCGRPTKTQNGESYCEEHGLVTAIDKVYPDPSTESQ